MRGQYVCDPTTCAYQDVLLLKICYLHVVNIDNLNTFERALKLSEDKDDRLQHMGVWEKAQRVAEGSENDIYCLCNTNTNTLYNSLTLTSAPHSPS